MEERIIDDPDGRLIRIKRTPEGDDAVEDALGDGAPAEETAGEETADGAVPEEFSLEFNDDEYDEDMVGLTPTRLKEKLAEREKAASEARDLCGLFSAEGEEKLAAGEYRAAAERFRTALSYVTDDARAVKGLWTALTENFTNDAAFYKKKDARALSAAPEEAREYVLGFAGERLTAERERLIAEERPLSADVEKKQAERRGPLRENRAYYGIRLLVLFAAILVCAVGICVSAYYTVRTTSPAPLIAIGVLGAGAAAAIVFAVLFARSFVVAARLCRANEKTSSTADGARLVLLREKIECLDLVLKEGADGEMPSERAEEQEIS